MVVPPHREGGQAQFVPPPMPPGRGRFSAALDWARGRLDRTISVAAFAREAGMSLRSFQRRFRAATGMSPAGWLLAERIGRAKELLETTTLPVERIATACGFGAPTHGITTSAPGSARRRGPGGRASAPRDPGTPSA